MPLILPAAPTPPTLANPATFEANASAGLAWWMATAAAMSGKALLVSDILGTVSQSAGVPTGALMERGSNANGEWLRFADGTQFAFSPALTGIAITTAVGALFRSANQSWTLPVGFVSTWAANGYTTGAYDCYVGPVAGATTLVWQAISPVSRSGMTFRLMQIGRWF